jgi:hypothetical protein
MNYKPDNELINDIVILFISMIGRIDDVNAFNGTQNTGTQILT